MHNLRPSSDLLSEDVHFTSPGSLRRLKAEKPNSGAHFFLPSMGVGIVPKAWARCRQEWHFGPGQ